MKCVYAKRIRVGRFGMQIANVGGTKVDSGYVPWSSYISTVNDLVDARSRRGGGRSA